MKIGDVFQSKYMKADDLPDEGSIALTILKISLDEIGKDKETKPIIHFEEIEKPLICNKTNARTIARLLGSDDLDDWIGKVIRLYRTETDFQGDIVDAIRVRSKPEKVTAPAVPAKPRSVPMSQPKAQVPEEEDEIPF